MPATISTHINIFKAPRHPAPRGRLTFAVLGRWWIRLRAFLRRCFGGRPAPDASTPTLPIIEDQEVLLNPDPEVVKGEPGEVPEWAAPLGTARRLERFESAVLDDLRRRPLQAEYRAGVVVPQGPASQASQGWGLANLAQLCAGIPEFRWPAVIAHHFDLIVRVGSQEARLERELKDYANARPQLVPRLWDEQAAGDIQDRAVWRRDIPGLLTVLSIDLPESIRTVNRELLEGWGVGEDQAFARAFDNLDALTDRTINAVELGGGQRLLEIRGPSYYTASLALKMDTLPELSGPHGAFVGLPTRHMLLSLPFSSPQTMEKLHLLLLATRAAEQQGPGALSHRVYWYRLGHWHEVAFEISPESLSAMPPRELVEYLRQLAEEGECVCGQIVSALPLAQATVSQHLKVLKDAGLVQGEIDGPRVCYCLNPEGLKKLKKLVAALPAES